MKYSDLLTSLELFPFVLRCLRLLTCHLQTQDLAYKPLLPPDCFVLQFHHSYCSTLADYGCAKGLNFPLPMA